MLSCAAGQAAPAPQKNAQHGKKPSAPPAIPLRSPTNITVEPNPELFAVLCALHAAGFEKDVSSVGFHPVRAELRSELLRLEGPAVEALRKYYHDHELESSAATLSRYVSFALVAGPPPKFEFQLRHDDLPPDVRVLEEFGETLSAFYAEARIERLWARAQPRYDAEIGRVSPPVRQIVLQTSGYLRELLKPQMSRSLTIYVDPMVGGTTSFRNYGDHYYVVLNPGAELPLDEVRHAMLHFLLDPLPLRYKAPVLVRKPLQAYAARAPRLPVEYRDDFSAFFTECLVRAVELRVRRLPQAKLAAAMDENDADGFILVRPIVRELAKFEQSEPAMTYYFPDLIRGINVVEESKRLEGVKFAALEAPAETKPQPTSETDDWLTEGERQIAAKNAEAAVAAFQKVLAKEPENPRAQLGMAVAAVLERDAERAKEMFKNLVISQSPGGRAPVKDPSVLAWSHVYLGRIYDVEDEHGLAVSEYRAALAVPGAPESARLAAQKAIDRGQTGAAEKKPGEPR